MNKSKDKWLKKFIQFFGLEKYKESLYIDSLRIIKILHASGKFNNNNKLLTFIENGWLNEFMLTADKKIYLIRFAKLYKKHYKLDPKRARRDLTPIGVIRRHSSQPLIFNSIKISDIRNRGLKKSTCGISKKIITYNKKIWLSIGIDEYLGFPKLTNAVNDAVQIGKFAQLKLGFESIVLKNNQANKYNIEKQIKKELFKSCSKNDLIVISFHGHGTTLDINGQSHGFIVPFLETLENNNPFGLISMQELCQWSNYLSSNHVLFIMDCCFSGFTAMRGNKNIIKESNFTNTCVQKMLSRKARVVINAGTEDEVVSDGGWGNNSILTGLIISYPFYHKTLGSSCHLYNYLLEQVPKRNSGQTPTIGKLNGDMGGDLFLAL